MTDAAREAAGPDARVTGRILVVDDDARNRLLLRDLLEIEGHQIREGRTGEEALEQVSAEPPDLLLLDVSMPGLDGFEVTRRLRAAPGTASLPIILVTSLSQRDQRLKGIAAGANDYVVKPIDGADLRLRVSNALQLRWAHQALAARYEELRRLEQMRDSLVHMIVHDLRSPLTGLLSYLELIEIDLIDAKAGGPVLAAIEQARAVGGSLGVMITNMLDVSRLEAGAMPLVLERTDLAAAIAAAVAAVGGAAGRVEVRIGPQIDVMVDPVLIRRVLVNLIANALRFSPSTAPVVIAASLGAESARITVTDQGPGIPAESHRLIFDKFGQVAAKEKRTTPSSGLGLTFCKLAVEAQGGAIGVESEPGRGSTFWFALPRH